MPIDKFSEYVRQCHVKSGLSIDGFGRKCGISKSNISKIMTDQRQGVSAKNFYLIYKGVGHTCAHAMRMVYPDLKLVNIKYTVPERNEFGNLMLQFESGIDANSPNILAQRTGISNQRMTDLYFKNGAAQAYELLLIEHAIGKRSGELFEMLYSESRSK